jgi:peptide/nickel transport system ATP-binding protein
LRAVNNVSLSLYPGETLGIVGESGSGKSTLGRCAFGITDVTAGQIRLLGQNFSGLGRREAKPLRKQLGFVFQDPIASLNPRMMVRDLIAEPMHLHKEFASSINERVKDLANRVGLSTEHLTRRPHELSGGQCQRVAIARALSTNPKVVLLDEPTSALDLSVQAQILNLLEELRREFSLTYLLISHDLDVVTHLSDRIAVMYTGRIVEIGTSTSVVDDPMHPYTRSLLRTRPGGGRASYNEVAGIKGEVVTGITSEIGCSFFSRCIEKRFIEDKCSALAPKLTFGTHQAACHLIEQQSESGAKS